MKEQYRAKTYDGVVVAKYAAKRETGYRVFEVDDKGYTIRELSCLREEIPETVADECDRRWGFAFSQVKIEN